MILQETLHQNATVVCAYIYIYVETAPYIYIYHIIHIVSALCIFLHMLFFKVATCFISSQLQGFLVSCDCPNAKTRQWGRWNWTWRWSCLRWVSEWLVLFMANDVNMCETRTHGGRPLRCQVFSVPGKLSNHVASCFQHFPKALQRMRSFESQDFA